MPTTVSSIAREHVEAFIEDLDNRFKPTTVGVRFRSLRQFFKWALEEGETTTNPGTRRDRPWDRPVRDLTPKARCAGRLPVRLDSEEGQS
jgi:site-specific recombinase XerD